MVVLLIIAAVLALAVVGMYNGLVTLRNRVSEAWSDIDVQLKRRYDLIPNLIETVKGYATHEQAVLQEVIAARARATSVAIDAQHLDAQHLADLSQAQQGLTGALGRLFALAESYPDLKANQNFLELQRELTDTEDKIQAARRFYNGTVRDFNTRVEQFPGNLIAGAFGFVRREFFELDDVAQRDPVAVKF